MSRESERFRNWFKLVKQIYHVDQEKLELKAISWIVRDNGPFFSSVKFRQKFANVILL